MNSSYVLKLLGNVTKLCVCFSNLSVKISCKSELNTHIRHIWSIERLETHVGDFSNYNHFIILNFLLMNKILNYRSVCRIMSQYCQSRCSVWPLPSFPTFSSRTHHWPIELLMDFFCQSIPCIWYCCWKPFDVFMSLYILVEHLFHHVPNCIIK